MPSILEGVEPSLELETAKELIRYNAAQSRRWFITASSWLAVIGFAYLFAVSDDLRYAAFGVFFIIVAGTTHSDGSEK